MIWYWLNFWLNPLRVSPLVGGRWVFRFLAAHHARGPREVFHFVYQTREGSSWTLDSTGRVRVSDPWRGKGRGGASDRRIFRSGRARCRFCLLVCFVLLFLLAFLLFVFLAGFSFLLFVFLVYFSFLLFVFLAGFSFLLFVFLAGFSFLLFVFLAGFAIAMLVCLLVFSCYSICFSCWLFFSSICFSCLLFFSFLFLLALPLLC